MLYRCPIPLLFLSIALSTSASVILLPPSIHVTDPGLATGNVSLKADVPDPRFSVSPIFDGSLLPIDPCLINVLYFMSEIAYGDFTQRRPPKTYRVPDYNEVEILTGTTMTAGVLIWGIWLAMEYMMSNSRFQNVLWTLRFKETVLGTIKIRASVPHPTIPGSSNIQRVGMTSIRHDTANSEAIVSDPNTLKDSVDAELSLIINSFADGKTLTKFEVYMICYTGLSHCAQKPTTARMQSFDSRSPIGDVTLHLYQYGPSLAYSYIIQALTHIPLYLLQDPRGLREINFDMELDQVRCARGAITKGRM